LQECNHESSRTDKYLDIPLVIKPFGQETSMRSVQEALWKFVEPEQLTGDNRYSCERCAKKVDATKGLKLTSLPYILCLQLKRFDFDFELVRRSDSRAAR
jgi:ubiquitin carboxyl-terminal hydrolase 47